MIHWNEKFRIIEYPKWSLSEKKLASKMHCGKIVQVNNVCLAINPNFIEIYEAPIGKVHS